MPYDLAGARVPFAAGTSLCPPNFEPPCSCPPGGIDPGCLVDGDVDVSAAGGAENSVPAGVAFTPVAAPAVDANQS